MTKKRFTFASIDEPAAKRSRSGPRVFLAIVIVCAGLVSLFQPEAANGPIARLAARLVQEWQATVAQGKRLLP
jgi:hypothetical protein